ncbi:MAG: 30S ribosomal protein S17 [Thermoprotei archaeon]|nr:30S ribosomal protein S17 [TACK group archaeon]
MPSKQVLGFQAPEAECTDPNCPFHGALTVRGAVFEGIVESARMSRTITVTRGTERYVQKYERYMREKMRLHAHLPPCLSVKEGDRVVVAECRPISKTVSFVVLGVVKGGQEGR